ALNMHTGLSPYYRGGQCTFWCFYENDLEHAGVTVHHLTQKIDGGDIVYTAQPIIEAGDTVRSLECKLVKLGTEKMVQAISEVHAGTAPRTKQTREGKLFLSKMYTLEKRLELEERLKKGRLRQAVLS
ncbi:MAG TPA: formyltransferase family protein, partial [bacterium]|nr:formyltransferase family protein [bacterium]